MDQTIDEILQRLEALRAKSSELGEQRKRLIAHIDEAVAQIHQVAAKLAETRARSAAERRSKR